MFSRVALPKNRTLGADDEVILCSWHRVNPPKIIHLTCNVTFTVDITEAPGKPVYVYMYVCIHSVLMAIFQVNLG